MIRALPILCVLFSTWSAMPLQVRINAPYVQTPPEVVRVMLELAEVSSQDVLYDLGSGDGRIVIAAAKQCGARAVGFELDTELIDEARAKAAAAGVSARVQFIKQDFFDADLSPATVVTLYLLPEVNRELLPVLRNKLKPGTRIVSHAFGIADWQPDRTIEVNGNRVFLWRVRP
jgi:cyclopropane fatty-acyl-phospholipid synthase-like methyltransferase